MKSRQINAHNTENRLYQCNYCGIEYLPNKRRIQKYCSSSCRSKAYHYRESNKSNSTIINSTKSGLGKPVKKKIKIEKMSLAGVGNAAAGALAVNLIEKVLTPPASKPATKADIERIESKLARYHLVKGQPTSPDGYLTYFDLETNSLVRMLPDNLTTE